MRQNCSEYSAVERVHDLTSAWILAHQEWATRENEPRNSREVLSPNPTPARGAVRGRATGTSRSARAVAPVETPEEEESEPTCELCWELGSDCTCWTCQGCHKKRFGDVSRCECCECCERCCECSYCDGCGPYNPDYRGRCRSEIQNCNRCGNCCDCNNEEEEEEEEEEGPRVSQRLRIEKPTNLLGYTENKLRRPVSVEVEYTDVEQVRDDLRKWAIKTGAGLVGDSSISGPRGTEVNTNPAAGNIFLQRMDELGEIVKDCDHDNSCGMHVHVDASDYSQWDLRKLIMLWAGVESTMYELIARQRWGNTYCMVSSRRYVRALLSDDTIEVAGDEEEEGQETPEKVGKSLNPAHSWGERIAQAVYESHGRDIYDRRGEGKRHKYDHSRYHGLNLHSYFFRKTIEVRLFESTTSVETLKNWPLVCGNIIDFASRSTERTIMDMLRSEVSGKGLLLSILPDAQRVWALETLEKRKAARLSYGTQESTEQFIANIDKYRAQLISGQLWKEKEKSVKVRERKPAKGPIANEFAGMMQNVTWAARDDMVASPLLSVEALRAAHEQLLSAAQPFQGNRVYFSYDIWASPLQGDAIPVLQERE